MNTPGASVAHYRQLAEITAQQQDGQSAAWLTGRRAAARARLGSVAFPTRKQEGWRYTSIDALLTRRFATATDDRGLAKLIGLAVERGVKIAQLHEVPVDLEDAFLQVTAMNSGVDD